MAPSSPPSPDRETIYRHLSWLCAPALADFSELRVEISWGDPDTGPNRTKTFAVNELSAATGFAVWINSKGCNAYVGVTLKRADTPAKGRTRTEHAAMATCIPIDIDSQLAAVATRAGSLARPQLLVVTGQAPEPRGQLFVRLAQTTDLGPWEVLHGHIVHLCGGDENALGRNRLMRLAGTVSYPSPTKIGRGYIVEQTTAHFILAPEYTVNQLLASIPAPPVRAGARTQLLPSAARMPISRGSRVKPPVNLIAAALRTLPDHYATEHNLWLRVGFALHDFDPGASGLSLWESFSHRHPDKARNANFPALWQGFNRLYAGHRITFEWLLCEARRSASKVKML